ncbi:MAG: hypothetical protein NUW22_10815 [Acidobacteria bacterium]|nr:hypothetical protein [Acidobacteriota bacterium]
MKLKNGDLKAGLDAMEALCTGANRLPILAALRADRTYRRLREAWAPVAEKLNQLILDHGEPQKDEKGADTGQVSINPSMAGWAEYVAARADAFMAESEVNVETLTLADIEAGWSKEDGKKGPLDIAPASIGHLIVLGIVVDPAATEAPGPKVVPDEPVAAVG